MPPKTGHTKKKRKVSQLEVKQLPQRLLPIDNPDKKWHEKWDAKRDPLNFPHPFRALLIGPPNSGKSTTILNIIARVRPHFEKIIIIYPGGIEGTKEYDVLGSGDGIEFREDFPAPDYFPTVKSKSAVKTLVIIDDMELREIGGDQRAHLDRLFGHVSTHRNVSIMLGAQQFFNVPPIARRLSNLFITWKPRDLRLLNEVSSRVGEDLAGIFNALRKNNHDSIWVDMTKGTPYPLRWNGYQKINTEGGGEKQKEEGE